MECICILPGYVPKNHMTIFQPNPERRIGKVFYHLTLHPDHIVFGHSPY